MAQHAVLGSARGCSTTRGGRILFMKELSGPADARKCRGLEWTNSTAWTTAFGNI